MSVDGVSGGPSVVTVVQAGLSFADWANRNKGWTKKDQAKWEAAQSIGYTQREGRFPLILAPDGKVATPKEAKRAGAAVLRTPPLVPLPAPPPPAPLPTGGDILEDLLRRPSGRIGTGPLPRTDELGRDLLEDLLNRPRTPPPEPATVPKIGRTVARVLGRVGGIIGGVLYPTDTADDDLYPPGTAVPAPQPQPEPPDEPPPRPVTVPEAPLPVPVDTWPSPTPRPADEFPPSRPPTAVPEIPIPVLLPIPGDSNEPAPRPDPSPTATALPTPASVPFDFPLAFPFPFSLPFVSPRPRLTNRPGAFTNPELGTIPGFAAFQAPAPRGLTRTQTSPLRSEPPDDSRCRCSKPKRKPKKPRTECRTGTYIERASGIQKTPTRRVPCR